MKKNYEWRKSVFFKKLTGGLFALVMLIGLSGTVNGQACTIDNIQGGIASGTLSIFATPGNGLAALFDPAGTGAAADPGCGAVLPYDYTISTVELLMADPALFGLPGEGLGTLEYTVSIVNSIDDSCTIMGATLWTSAVLTEVMADQGFHPVSIPVDLVVTGKFFVKVNTVSWDGAADRSPSVFLWDGVERPDCRQVVITDGGATETDHGNFFTAPANGWYNVSVVGHIGDCLAIICDDFDDYTPGFLNDQAVHWDTWSGDAGTAEDGIVTTDQANSPANSMYVGDNGSQDVLLFLGNQTSGSYSLEYNLYVPAGKEGYYNIQEDEVAGVAWNLDVFFNEDGAAPGIVSFAQTDETFAYPEDEWFNVLMVIDLDADLMSFWLNGALVFEGFVFDGSIGAIDIFSISGNHQMYMDDVVYDVAGPLSPCGFPTIICDNFDSYNVGGLGEQAAHWSTWSGDFNTPEDGIVTTDQANSAPNSLYVGDNGAQDVLLLLGNQTAGTYSIEFNVYVPAGKEGYYNIQEDEVAGVAWNLDVLFNEDGLAPGTVSFLQTDETFAYPEDEWFAIKMVIDLEADLMSFWLNGDIVFEGFVYDGSIGAIDIFSISGNHQMYMDDVIYDTHTPLNECGFPTIICDNFDSYTTGFLGPQADHWSTWSGTFETDEDGIVTTDQANSPANSMYVGDNGAQDVLLFLGNKTSGSYSLEYNLYVPAGKEGYFNIQEDEVAGVAWNLDVLFNEDGLAPGTVSFLQTDETFAYPEDEWFHVLMTMDLDADLMSFWLNGDLVFEGFVYDGSIGAVDIFSISANHMMYMDDVIYYVADPLSDCGFPTIICDNLDSYNVGGLGEQADHWSTWSGDFNTPEDGIVTTDQANSAPNSLYVGDNGAQDVLLFLGNQTAGVYTLSYNIYVVAGKEGYFNIQEDEVAGVAWNLDVLFNEDGLAPGTVSFLQTDETFAYPEDEWFAVEMVIDLDKDLMEFFLNGTKVFTMDYLGSLGAIDIFSISGNHMMYMDDVVYFEGGFIDAVEELTGLASFELYPNPSDGNFTIVTGELSGSFLLDMVDLTGRVVYSEQMEISNNETRAISINDLNTGVYILRMVDQTTSEIYTTRVSIR